MSPPRSAESVAASGAPDPQRRVAPGVELAGRFRVEEELGVGGMGRVFAAFDRERRVRVALKVLGKLTPRSIVLLKREFRAAAELAHPNLVRLHELFSNGIEWFFTMDLVEGKTLELLGRPLDVEVLRHVLKQLALALSALHQAGTLHGDLKPSNFLVTADRRVVLLDFGVARPSGSASQELFGGTPAYMAPEQALGDTLTEAADWYAFGVVLYEALAGALPMRRPSLEQLARAPEDLAQLCMDLLQLEPTRRPTGDEVLRRLGVSDPETEASSVRPAAVSRGLRLPLVGREHELAQLFAAFERAGKDGPSIVFLHGPSGIGKTALVEHFLETAAAGGSVILTGRCRERESMAYKALDGLVDDLVRELDRLAEMEAVPPLPDDVGDLTILFPALLAARAIASAPRRPLETPDQSIVRLHAIASFRELLARLRAHGPLVVWIDDLQWSDGDSALLLGPVLGGPDPVPVLFIGSYRSDAGGRGPTLDALFGDRALALPRPTELPLGPLLPEHAERLASAVLRSDEPGAVAMARDIARDAGGHPLFIAELAHSVASCGGSSRPDRPSTLHELVTRRIATLPADARGLLEATAVAGVPLARGVLRSAQGLGPAGAEAALDLLRVNHLVRSRGLREDDAVDIHHDRIREIVLQGLGNASRAPYHLKLARVLESSKAPGKPDLVAAHYEAGGDLPRAGRFWIAAADQASKALAFAQAAELYARGIARAILPPGELLDVQIRRAEALASAGKGAAAAAVYLQIAETCARDQAVELQRRAAEQLLLSGHVEEGLDVIERVLRAIGMRGTRGGRLALMSAVAGQLALRARGLRHVARSESDLSREEVARLDASWTIACSLAGVDFIRGADFQTSHMLLALRAGEPRRLLRALSLQAGYSAGPGAGSERRTRRLLQVAGELAARSDDQGAIGLLLLARGTAAYLQGQLESALGHYDEALGILRNRSGAIWETMTAQRFVIASLFFLGRFRRLADLVPPLVAQADGTGNRYATMCFRAAYSTVAWLVGDAVPDARRQLGRARAERAREGADLSGCNLLIGETFVDFYTGDMERAAARIREQWPGIARAQLLRVGVLRVQLWQLRAASASATADVAEAHGQGARARRLRSEARHFAQRLRHDTMSRARALGELVDAAVDRSEGEIASAQRRLERCVAAFHDQGLRLFAAAARARLGEVVGGERGRLLIEGAHAEAAREGVVAPSRMLDLLAPGYGPRA